MAEGQYRLSDETYSRLATVDDALLAALEADDSGDFHRLFHEALAMVRSGERLEDSALTPSDLVLPPEDTSMEDAKRLLESDL